MNLILLLMVFPIDSGNVVVQQQVIIDRAPSVLQQIQQPGAPIIHAPSVVPPARTPVFFRGHHVKTTITGTPGVIVGKHGIGAGVTYDVETKDGVRRRVSGSSLRRDYMRRYQK